MVKYFLMVLTAALLTGVFGCSSKSETQIAKAEDPPAFDMVKSDLQRVAPAESVEDMAKLSEKNNDFALKLYDRLAGEQGNIIFSPYSISTAMSMLYAGARNETQQQISDVFNFPIPQDSMHPLFNALDQHLLSQNIEGDGAEKKGLKLEVANQLFMNEDLNPLTDYLDILALYYGAGIGILDFAGNPDECIKIINGWIEKKTRGLIKDVVNDSSINKATKLALINSIYFKAGWENKFKASSTAKGDFYLENGDTVQTDMMHQMADFRYYATEELTAVELPYEGKNVSMLLIKPETAGVSSFEKTLSTEFFGEITGNLHTGNVMLSMPKFKIESDAVKLKDILSDMGMPVAFTELADFSGITNDISLMIGSVIHKAFIDVNEDGTEAAAATVISGIETCGPNEPVLIAFNSPFIFLIRDNITGTILFLGRFSKPA